MRKYFLATIVFLLGIVMLVPATVFAQVSFSEDTNVYLEGSGITLVIESGSLVHEMTVYSTYVEFDLVDGSNVTVTSNDLYILTASPFQWVGSCRDDYYQIILDSDSTIDDVKITVGDACTTGGGGGAAGGGGGGAIVTAPVTATGLVTATASGGKTTVTTGEGTKASVQLPTNAVTKNTDVKVAPVAKATVTVTAPVPAGKGIPGGYVFNYTAISAGEAVTTFLKTVTLTFTYTDAQVANIEESTLTAYYWDAAASEWVALTSTVNTATNKVTAKTDHFTYFTLMGDLIEEVEEMTIAELKAEIARITALIVQLQAQLAELIGVAYEGCTITSFDQNLQQGDSGDDVKCLQIILNSSSDTQLAAEGVGSSGNETTYLGPLTKAAVIEFQEKYTADTLTPWDLTEGTGFVGSTTRTKLNELLLASE